LRLGLSLSSLIFQRKVLRFFVTWYDSIRGHKSTKSL
jgi:hypothetical protein